MFSEKCRRDIVATANAIGQDVEATSAMDMAEMTLDADRVAMYGSKESNSEIIAMIKEHGWKKVQREAAKIVPW